MIYVYSELQSGFRWLRRYHAASASFACVLGFTETGLIPGISAAGATPEARQYTAIADAEFLARGVQPNYAHPLPILDAGISPTFISRAVIEALDIPTYIFNAGLPHPPTVDTIDLSGVVAKCLSSGAAMPLEKVKHLFHQGLAWGEKLAQTADYLIIGECVVGGTTTALALLTALGIEAQGMVNSSHPQCNHSQKWSVVESGLSKLISSQSADPWELVAAVGDPMQITVAGMAIAASRHGGVMLAGGTQMLAVYALIKAIARYHHLTVELSQIVVGTTRWVAEDNTGNTVGLAKLVGGVPLLATGLSFAISRYPSLRAYTQGYVKEGVGAGGCAIASHLKQNWTSTQLLTVIEGTFARYRRLRVNTIG
ncbi:MAG: nicotinate mononucleotide-dependent phosphoribosyltransferase CobT [Cyanobacteria bacterium J06631_2]